MPKLSETELLKRDAERDLNAELLESINQMHAGQIGRVSVVTRTGQVIESPVAKARIASRLSQSQFAKLLGISVRTLQEWEQGRRQPSGAAKTLLRVAENHPEYLRELA
ncbi:helix-turn-helix domain-containing protein [Crenothrix sp.]|jgi:putative transcriptional regulator|uniref:helix-turn-helix domain-containing protein n=1 Tax=Crenothrix sp. TaxID=3100433 RepID=UPI00374D27F5